MNQFEQQIQKGVTLIDFNASWCAPCKAQEPIIKKLKNLYQNKASIVEIDIDEHRDLATRYMVQSIPTLILFKDGKEVKRFVGLQTEITIAKNIDELL
jgi:thioredoxin 1